MPLYIHSEIGLDPGPWTVEAVVEDGAATALEDIDSEDGVIDVVWIYDNVLSKALPR